MFYVDWETWLNSVNEKITYTDSTWTKLNDFEISPGDYATTLETSGQYSIVKNQNGDILSITRNTNTSASITQNTSSEIGYELNSNTDLGTYADNYTIGYAGQSSVGTEGNVEFAAGVTTAAGVSLAAIGKAVVPAIICVGLGALLGKTIDSALYNINPDFWDDNNLSTVDPDTWGLVSADSDTVGSKLWNVLFAIDEDDGTVTPYAQEDAIALAFLYMCQEGVFTNYTENVIDDETASSLGLSNNVPHSVPQTTSFTFVYTEGTRTYTSNISIQAGNAVLTVVQDTSSEYLHYYVIASSTSPFVIRVDGTDTSVTSSSYLYGSAVYAYFTNITVSTTDFKCAPMWGISHGLSADDYHTLEYILAGIGTTENEPLDGVGNQEGAEIPDQTKIKEIQTIEDAKEYLEENFPDEFGTNAGVDYDIAQEDGTEETYGYWPFRWPSASDKNDSEPETEDATQEDPNPDDDHNGESLADTVSDPDPDTEPTGEGDSPTGTTPTGSASALYQIYNPTQAQLNSFGAWLWSSNFVDQILKVFSDPMQAIIGLHKVFVGPPVSGQGPIKVGYLNSGVSANIVSGQYTSINCGTVSLREYFGNVLDYTDTTVRIYLPFIGIHELDVDDVMRSSITVTYHVDVLTGATLAEVSVQRDLAGGVLYTFSGNCAVQYPVSSGNYVGMLTGALSIAGGIVGTALTGGTLAPALLGGASAMTTMKTHVSHSGNLTGAPGAMGIKKPYLIIERPQTAIASSFPELEGYGANTTVTLSSCSGYTKVKDVHIEGIPATDTELNEIEALLKSGIII